jgi:predicted ester cyclase
VAIEHLLGEDTFVVVRWRFEGSHTVDTERWGPASGRVLAFPSTWLRRVADGAVQEDWETRDAVGVAQRTRSTA